MCRGCTHILRPYKFCFFFVSEKKGVETQKIYTDIHKVIFKIFCIFLAS